MNIRLGNLSPEQFADRVGAEFTSDELAELHSVWSQWAELTGPEDFHIFDAPTIFVTIGSVSSRAVEIFKAANARKTFNREVTFGLDDRFKGGDAA